jgi:hypothetical protein
MNTRIEPARFLRKALMADGIVSGASGLALLAAPGAIASLIGAPSAAVVAGVGFALVIYGLALVRNARRETPSRSEAATAVALNLAWLVGTAVVVVAGGLTREGNWALILVGDVVLVFTALEVIGLRKMAAVSSTPAAGEVA